MFIDVLWIVKDYYGENKGVRNINKFLSTLDNNKKTKFLRNGFGIKGVIPKNIEFDLTDLNITKRLEVLKRLSETDKILYLKHLSQKTNM